MENEVLTHHGIKGQKWGIRRFQNADGSLTSAGRKRYGAGNATTLVSDKTSKERTGMSDSQKEMLKKVGKAALIAGSVAAAGYLVASNPQVCQTALNTIGNLAVDTLDSTTDTLRAGKEYVKELATEAKEGAKAGIAAIPKKVGEGVSEGIAEGSKAISKALTQAPYTVGKIALEGAAIIATKKMLESVIGKEQVDDTTKAYNAYHKKNKIGQLNQKKEDDDDE